MAQLPQWDPSFLFGPGNYAAGIQAASVANQRQAQMRRQALDERQQSMAEQDAASVRAARDQKREQEARQMREELEYKNVYDADYQYRLDALKVKLGNEPSEEQKAELRKQTFVATAHKLPTAVFTNINEAMLARDEAAKLEDRRFSHNMAVESTRHANALDVEDLSNQHANERQDKALDQANSHFNTQRNDAKELNNRKLSPQEQALRILPQIIKENPEMDGTEAARKAMDAVSEMYNPTQSASSAGPKWSGGKVNVFDPTTGTWKKGK